MFELRKLKDSILRATYLRRRINDVAEKQALYACSITPERIVEFQINRFNQVWATCLREHPFYRAWAQRHELPSAIEHVQQLRDFPTLTKVDLQENEALVFSSRGWDRVISTGGSSGRPTRFPGATRDFSDIYANVYTGRGWWGIQPLSPTALFWGHSHLFGTGMAGRLNEFRRRLADAVINVLRLNAYDMRPTTIRRYLDAAERFGPEVLIGYTSCVYQLARWIQDNGLQAPRLRARLKAVIPTAETVTQADIGLMEGVFGVPVVIEYGMAETGVIAYSREITSKLQVFWDSFCCIIGDEGDLRVTTLSNKAFPLINYQTDDVVSVTESCAGSVLRLSEVRGRTKDVLQLSTVDGPPLVISGILLVHALKALPGLSSIQFEQLADCRVRLLVSGQVDIKTVKRCFISEIAKDHPNIDESFVEFAKIEDPVRTVAGKTPLLVSAGRFDRA